MTLIRRPTPLGELVSLRQAMDRRFEDSFVRPAKPRRIQIKPTSQATGTNGDQSQPAAAAGRGSRQRQPAAAAGSGARRQGSRSDD